MEYDIIKTEGPSGFESMIAMVNVMIIVGWRPQGGISCIKNHHGEFYHQAITREAKAPELTDQE